MTTISYWDEAADSFDEEPDHGLLDPVVRDAWAQRLQTWLPATACEVLDLGCGTGSLSLLAAGQGHRITAVDQSPRMVEQARGKLAGTGSEVLVGDAARPPVGDRRFDVVLVRHVLWALPEPAAALETWFGLLKPGGRLVLIEGVWGGVGVSAARLTALLAPYTERVHHEPLSADSRLWGKDVDDERYAVVARAEPRHRHTEVVDVHLILRQGPRVLLARRAGTGYADGLLHLPSGHLEDGEDVREAIVREAAEEIGVTLQPEELRVALVMHHRGPGGSPRTGWFFEAEYDSERAPYNAEPAKCSELDWFPLDALPEDMVAYCRAGLDGYRSGEHFLIHWHEDGDPVAHDPGLPRRAVPLPSAGTGTGRVHHIELWVSDLAEAAPGWDWLLGRLGHLPYQRWSHGRSWRRGDSYVVIEESPDAIARTHDRLRPGLNHLAFHVEDRETLDALAAQAPAHGWRLLFADRHPYAGGDGHRAAYLENAAGFEVELVAAGPGREAPAPCAGEPAAGTEVPTA
ncbi:trifunctional class I SAM-dependent methyltransferase/NUDIX hydrolase/VOC family protein [Streptomyces sp. AM 2-1-1]|uniref:trifunctional class I SAM-dependent methyltransferase/NUDIX hydrolase/VOC family protein n=1 Tax=Streptomyces sp. AM 2-1-1 TaxID=3028709 RepID=UPI0023B95BFC|nr:trifunctional class I SAM-dependent methyltransferase/NUDIX hydrolase/VOC family protein [Streptomyces sp. AM 2-1-1]WEH42601.1 trifunctional class I SAM-dependent methyltransferase/NUDIX hydrolase/VOC family protein [Streptomyces sp. AM 2-1-1]